MKGDTLYGMGIDVRVLRKEPQPGRPRAIPEQLEPLVIELYRRGSGYRSIATLLGHDYAIRADFSSVKRLLRRLGVKPHPGTTAKPKQEERPKGR